MPPEEDEFEARWVGAVTFTYLLPLLLVVSVCATGAIPVRYAVEFFTLFVLVSLATTILAAVGWYLPLPDRPFVGFLALSGYAWPYAICVILLSLGWPESHLVFVQCFEFTIATLVVCGVRWLVLNGHALPLWKKSAIALLFPLGIGIILIAYPIAVTIDGLVAMAKIPAVREATYVKADKITGSIGIAHLSDLHFTGSRHRRTMEGNVSGDSLISPYVSDIVRLNPRFVLITGDITDGGESNQWDRALEYLWPLRARSPVIMAPGNHDLNGSYAETKEKDANRLVFRQIAYLDALNRLNTDIHTATGEPLAELMARLTPSDELVEQTRIKQKDDYLRRYAYTLPNTDRAFWGGYVTFARKFAETEFTPTNVRTLLIAEAMRDNWGTLFPLYWRSKADGFYFFILNSSDNPDAKVGRSAIGSFCSQQIATFSSLLTNAVNEPDTQFVGVLTHHPLARPPDAWNDLKTPFEFGKLHLSAESSTAMLEILLEHKRRRSDIEWCVFYGHRHRRSLGDYFGLRMLEAPCLLPPSKNESQARERGVWVLFPVHSDLQVGWIPLDH